jgi:hypothetical protein
MINEKLLGYIANVALRRRFDGVGCWWVYYTYRTKRGIRK